MYVAWAPVRLDDEIVVDEIPSHPGIKRVQTMFVVYAGDFQAANVTARLHSFLIARIHGFLQRGDSSD